MIGLQKYKTQSGDQLPLSWVGQRRRPYVVAVDLVRKISYSRPKTMLRVIWKLSYSSVTCILGRDMIKFRKVNSVERTEW